MAEQIKIRIGLEGDEDIKKKLDGISAAGKRPGDEISKSLNTARDVGSTSAAKSQTITGTKPQSESVSTGRLGKAISSEESSEQSRVAVERLREALHILHPALAEADIGFGELSGILKAAGGGVAAFGLAVAGTLVAALQKAGDEANDAAARIGAFAGSTAKGREAFHGLQETAGQLRVPTGDLTAPFEQLLRANQSSPAGTQTSDKGLQETLATFVKGAQADRTDFDKAIGGITEFFASLKENGALTPEATGKLLEVAPTLTKQILDDLSKRLPGKQTYSTQDVVQSTANIAPQVNQNLLNSQADAVDSISTAWVHFKASVDKLEEAIGGGGPVSSILNEVAEAIAAIAEPLKKIREYAKDAAGRGAKIGAEIGGKLPIPGSTVFGGAIGAGTGVAVHAAKDTFEKATGLVRGEAERRQEGTPDESISTSGILQKAKDYYFPRREAEETPTAQHPALGSAEPTAVAENAEKGVEAHGEASEKAAKQVEEHGNAAEGAQKSLNQFAEGASKLQIIGSELSKQQAAIDLKFQPAEAASAQAKDQIAVQNADIHQKQAAIGVEEANKGVEQAALAPAAAHNSVANASNALEAAQIASLKSRGVNTSNREILLQRAQVDQAEKDAELALKRAKIDEKYSYLDQPKAELSAQKAQTDIRSAEIEKSDTSLKLAKDTQGAPISHELAQLRYAQASLDELKLTSKYGEETVGKLQDILNALTKDAKAGDSQRTEKTPGQATAAAQTGAPEFNPSRYESEARRTGLRTVEGDRQAREQAHAQGKTYGTEHTVESDRLAREKPTAGHEGHETLNAPAEKLSDAADELKQAAQQLKGAANKSGDAGASSGGGSASSAGEGAATPTSSPTGDGQASSVPSDESQSPPAVKSPNDRVAEEFDQLKPKPAGETAAAAAAAHSAAAPTASAAPIPPPGGAPHDRANTLPTVKYSHPEGVPAESGETTRPGFYRAGPGQPEYPTPEQNGPARNRYEVGKEWIDHHEFSAADGQVHRDFTNHIRDQLGVPHETPQGGVVPHPKAGTADLSERMTIPFNEDNPEQPRRYRFVKDGYQPPTLGKYDENMNFVPAPNKDQPYPKLRNQSSTSGRPYSPLEDTYDTKGDGNKYVPGAGSFPPIYDYGQSQPLSFPKYNKEQYDSLPEPLPRPRPPEAPPRPPEADGDQSLIDDGSDTQLAAASGGYISGPGTTTSDSIPAMLSDKEFVHNAKAVEHYGVPFMDAINNRTLKFAAGGLADSDKLRAVKGIVDNGVDEGSSDTPSGIAKAKKDGPFGNFSGNYGEGLGFRDGGPVGHFAGGGSVGNSSAIANFRNYVSNHYADGGIVDAPQFELPEMPSLAPLAAHGDDAFSPALSVDRLNLLHPVTLNLPGGGSVSNVYAAPSAVKQLTAAAIDARTFSTGKKPAWYGGRG